LAAEYRRLADMALTTQEHTDLKLGDISAQLDHLQRADGVAAEDPQGRRVGRAASQAGGDRQKRTRKAIYPCD